MKSTRNLVPLEEIEEPSYPKLKSTPVKTCMKWAPRMEYDNLTEEIMQKYVFNEGIPLVLSNASKALQRVQKLPRPDLFSMDYLHDVAGEIGLLGGPRDVDTLEDLTGWTLKQYIEHLFNEEHEQRRLYGKDITPPQLWSEYLSKTLYPFLVWKDNGDLLGDVPLVQQSESVMIYVGYGGTRTPAHKDICGTIGHNLMVHAPLGSFSYWFCMKTGDKDKVAAFWKQNKESLDADNYFMPISTLLRAPFDVYVIKQMEGDLVIIPSEGPHQVMNMGRTAKFAWNRLPSQLHGKISRKVIPLYRELRKPEVYRVKLVGYYGLKKRVEQIENGVLKIQHLKDLPFLLCSLEDILRDEWISTANGREMNIQKFEDDVPHKRWCNLCHCDIFNRCFHSAAGTSNEDEGEKELDICINCAAEGKARKMRRELGFQVWETLSRRELYDIAIRGYDCFALLVRHFKWSNAQVAELVKSVVTLSEEQRAPPVMHLTLASLRKSVEITNTVITQAWEMMDRSLSCHSCHIKFPQRNELAGCKGANGCLKSFCHRCLHRLYGVKLEEIQQMREWACYFCQGTCLCPPCRYKRREKSPQDNGPEPYPFHLVKSELEEQRLAFLFHPILTDLTVLVFSCESKTKPGKSSKRITKRRSSSDVIEREEIDNAGQKGKRSRRSMSFHDEAVTAELSDEGDDGDMEWKVKPMSCKRRVGKQVKVVINAGCCN